MSLKFLASALQVFFKVIFTIAIGKIAVVYCSAHDLAFTGLVQNIFQILTVFAGFGTYLSILVNCGRERSTYNANSYLFSSLGIVTLASSIAAFTWLIFDTLILRSLYHSSVASFNMDAVKILSAGLLPAAILQIIQSFFTARHRYKALILGNAFGFFISKKPLSRIQSSLNIFPK